MSNRWQFGGKRLVTWSPRRRILTPSWKDTVRSTDSLRQIQIILTISSSDVYFLNIKGKITLMVSELGLNLCLLNCFWAGNICFYLCSFLTRKNVLKFPELLSVPLSIYVIVSSASYSKWKVLLTLRVLEDRICVSTIFRIFKGFLLKADIA